MCLPHKCLFLLYTDETPVKVDPENSKSLVDLDVTYWPQANAMYLFFAPTIGETGEIKPYSPVNVMERIVQIDKNFLKDVKDGLKVTFRLINLVISNYGFAYDDQLFT